MKNRSIRKNIIVKMKLIEIQLFFSRTSMSNSLIKGDRFSLKLIHRNKVIQSGMFNKNDQHYINLLSCQTVSFHHIISISDQEFSYIGKFTPPFLTIILTNFQNLEEISTTISEDVLVKIINGKQKSGNYLYFPMMSSSSPLTAEMGIQIWANEVKNELETKIIISKSPIEYFCPVYSTKNLQVSLQDQLDEDIKFSRQQYIQKEDSDIRNSLKSNQIDTFNQFESIEKTNERIESININKTDQSIINPAESPAQEKPQNQQSNSPSRCEVPEDYRYLFQKIAEINKKYEPLERIQSKQSFQSFSSYSQNPLNKSLSQISWHSQKYQNQITKHLSQSEQMLKELNLYKYGTSLIQKKL